MISIQRTAFRTAALVVPLAVVLGSTGVALAKPGNGHKPRTTPSVLTAKPAAVTNSRVATFTWTPPGVAGYTYSYTCSRDGAAATTCASGISYSGLSDGQHGFVLKTVAKNSGGFSSKPVGTSWSWKIDTVAPSVPVVNPIASPTSNTNATITFSDTDATATFTCSLDGAVASACTSPVTFSGLTDGLHTVVVTARDAAGNTASRSVSWTVDHSAPNIPDVVGPTSPTNATSAVVTFTGAATDTFRCQFDALPEVACTSPWSSGGSALPDGAHTLVVTPIDGVGNRGAAGHATWIVDTVAPAAPLLVSGPASPTSLLEIPVQFADLDLSVVRYGCVLDGAPSEGCESGYTVTDPVDGAHTLAIRAYDAAGNASGPLTVSWTEDSVSLPAQFLSGPATPTPDTHPVFDFSPTDPTTTAFECSLDSGAFATCQPGDAFDVAADGAHDLRVRALDDAVPANVSPAVTWSWTLDTAAPVTAPVAGGPTSTGTASAPPVLTFGSSDSTVAGFVCSVDGGPFVACVSGQQPAVGDGAHTVVVAPVDQAGNQGTQTITFTFTVDTTPPAGAPEATGSTPLVSGAVSTVPTLTFGSSDPTVVSFVCSVDGGPLAPCTSGFQPAVGEGAHTVTVFAVDAAGNVGTTPLTYTFTLDTTPPASGPVADGAPLPVGPVATAPALTFSSTDSSVTGFVCSVDGGAFVSCASGFVPTVGDGAHTVVVAAVDAAGNHAVDTLTYTFSTDSTGPAVAPTADGSLPLVIGAVTTVPTFAFSSTDPDVAGFVCSVDGVTAACTSPFTPIVGEGAHTVVIRTVDALGNASANALTYTFTLDTTPPASGPVADGAPLPTEPVATAPALTFSSTDPSVTGFVCSVDGGVFVSCASGFVPTVGDGAHTVVVAAVDAAGNHAVDTLTYTFSTYSADVTGPAVAPTAEGTLPMVIGAVSTVPTFAFSSTDPDVAGFVCSVDGVTAACTSPFTPIVGEGAHTVLIRTVDALGNPSTNALTYLFTLDTAAPATAPVAGTTLPSTPLLASPVLTFSSTDPDVTGFVCSVDGSAFAACTSGFQPIVTDGAHTVVVAPVDAAGNQGTQTLTYAFTTDATPPVTGPVAGGTTPTNGGTVTTVPVLDFGSSDPTDPSVTGYACSVDGGPFFACTPGYQPPVGDGSHTVTIVTVDSSGNHSSSSIDYSFTLDSTRPSATTGAPATLVAPVLLTFSEDVHGLTVGNVVLRVVGGSLVATKLTCQGAAGAAVPCTGTVRRAVLTPVAPLVPGQRYQPSVSTAVLDAAGNPAAVVGTVFRAQLVQQESSPAIAQVWGTVATTSAIGGRYVRADRTGASASYAFKGTAVTWYTVVGPTMGTAKVYVDGVYKGTVNNYAAATKFKVARSITRLTNTAHTLKVVATGLRGSTAGKGSTVALDAVKVGATLVGNPSIRTAWALYGSTKASGGKYVVADQAGDAVTMTFRGTRLIWTTVAARDMGRARVYVDGVLKATVDNYAAAAGFNVRRVWSLTDKVHTVKIVVLGNHRAGATGNRVVIDNLTVA